MCGIAGVVANGVSIDPATLVSCNRCLRHRGPDAASFWLSPDRQTGFAQTRLAIVDLDQRADQPLVLEKGKLVICFNGEIYNYLELRAELEGKYRFRTTSDTEVLGYAYREWGVAALKRLEGMFAFAIYDGVKGEVLIARDHVGQKPLLYSVDGSGFAFASEIPALLLLRPEARKGVDLAALQLFLAQNFSHIPQPFSAFGNIRKLEPSHYMIVRHGAIIEHKQYYRLRKRALARMDEDVFLTGIAERMKPRDVTFCSFLSGGNDSALVCLSLRKDNHGPVHAYTLRVRKKDTDYERSKYIAKELDLKHSVVDFDPRMFLSIVDEQVRQYGEPYFHITSVYADQLLREVSKEHKVIFNGAGGDEVYYGYDNKQFLAVDALLKVQRVLPLGGLRSLVPRRYRFLLGAKLQDVKLRYYLQSGEEAAELLREASPAYANYARAINDGMFRQASIANYVDLTYMTGLFVENSHSLVIQGDLVGMRHSVEVRSPFLEKPVVERGFSLPLRRKISLLRLHEGKKALKQALLKRFSRAFVYGKKVGFGVEFDAYRSLIALHGDAIARKVRRLACREQFAARPIERLVASRELMVEQFTLVMKLYALETWFEEFVDERPSRRRLPEKKGKA